MMTTMSRKKCCVPGCMESGSSHQTLHLFPNPAKDRERFNKWVFAIGGDIIGLENEDIYQHRSVCHAHFEENVCCRNNRLSNIAVPTLNLPGPLSLPKFTYDERRPMRQMQNYSLLKPTPASSAAPSTYETAVTPSFSMPSTSATDSQSYTAEKENKDPANEQIILTRKAQHIMDKEHYKTTAASRATKIAKKHVRVTLAEQKLYQKLVQVRIKLSKCRNTVKKQSARLKAAKKLTSNPALLATMEKMPKTVKVLTMMQFREVKKKHKGRRFSLQEKILALSIFKQAPKGYRFLRKILILPAPQTLAKVISQADLKPGINKKIFSQLKNVTKKMKDHEKLCIVMFDEMSLKASVSFNEKKDKVTGFVTDGQETKSEFADHAQVYMIRGIIKNYKQPVAYTFSAAATSGQQIAKQLKQIIKELQEAGLIVIATVCDQGTNNRHAIKLLLQETRGIYLKNGEEPKENIMLCNNQEVIPLYDPPHLMKCIRNNLLTKNLQYISNGIKCTAKWEHLILLHKENPGYKGVRLIPKLTKNHVLPEKVLGTYLVLGRRAHFPHPCRLIAALCA